MNMKRDSVKTFLSKIYLEYKWYRAVKHIDNSLIYLDVIWLAKHLLPNQNLLLRKKQ